MLGALCTSPFQALCGWRWKRVEGSGIVGLPPLTDRCLIAYIFDAISLVVELSWYDTFAL